MVKLQKILCYINSVAFNHKYSLQEKELEKELNLNNQQPIIINLQTGVRDIKKVIIILNHFTYLL
ncbi:hypothetical protein [Spiroplasma endosymbiont of Polydrusus formosus]|uniref:hypothetical protein n=1 Tax=Spiroplasma endosymbiont of Polydrusus formosus TaxID=3139326 RepID=UPI0035B50B13